MSPKIAIFSDLHLTNSTSVNNKKFASLLKELRQNENINQLWLLGDIFDLLIGPFAFWREVHADIFTELKALRDHGCEIIWLEGNHDFHILELANLYGIEVLDGVQVRQIGHTQVLLAHGDLVNEKERAYLRWREVTRNPGFRALISLLPERLAKRVLLPIAEKISAKSRTRNAVHNHNLKSMYRAFADRVFADGYSALFLGHCHEFDLYTQGQNFYLNLGTWQGPLQRYALWEPLTQALPEVRNA